MSKSICAKCIAEGSVEEAKLAEAYDNGYEQGKKDACKGLADWLFDNASHPVWEEFVDGHIEKSL